MNIQVFGTKKSFDTKKAQRYFKERRVKFQFIDLAEKGMSKGELESVRRAVGGIDALVDPKAKDQDTVALLAYLAPDQKFDKLLDFAEQHGLYYVVTGHYARIEQDEQTGRWLLKKGVDAGKDQSYVLYTMTQRQLAHTKFPLGDRNKPEIRELAEQLSFCNARKHDSQDICFVPDGDYVKFMEQYTGKHYPAGDFLDLDGKPVGKHKGAVRYTVGQRRGLGLAMGEPVYVCGKDMEKNTVSVGPEAALFSDTVIVDDMNWIAIPELTEPIHIKAKIRYRHAEQPVTVSPLEDGRVKLVFDEPQRAAAIGQAAVLYDGDVVVGGGTIVDVPKQAGK